jgi:hypothetical protein
MMVNASPAANAAKSDAALDRIIHYINIWEKAFRLNLQPMVEEEQLPSMADFSATAPSAGSYFKSPGTKISYAPFDYVAVGQFILNGDVKVYMSRTGGLSSFSAVTAGYFEQANSLVLYAMDPRGGAAISCMREQMSFRTGRTLRV